MSINLLAINVGNSRTQIGSFRHESLDRIAYAENDSPADLAKALNQAFEPLRETDSIVYMSSVNEPQAQRVIKAVKHDLGQPVMRIEKDAVAPIGRQLDPETLVGEDRLLNAAAAYDQVKQAVVVISAGTAVTVDLVDGAGTFHGGAILPGAQMMLDALTNNTHLLPAIQFATPREAIGRNTVEAMLTGVFTGIRGAVRELVEQYAVLLGAYPRVLATGGNAQMLFTDYELVERVIPELTLMGIAVTHRIAHGYSKDE